MHKNGTIPLAGFPSASASRAPDVACSLSGSATQNTWETNTALLTPAPLVHCPFVPHLETGGLLIGAMFRSTFALFGKGQYKTRLKKRMVGFIPKVIPRKIRNNTVAMRSEANTGHIEGYIKTENERLDATGRKLQKVMWDPILQRHTLFRENKIRGPFMTKTALARRVDFPIGAKAGGSKK